ncbi:GTPase-associated system all-helical protein GASH [Chitinophaga rhizophila]|uniref:GTPase-associated system helical domain-containing protein n=1 Tax=Chitinophaga rhizophila TaxID=2866212 RepID=A0ABS7G7A1_9BACT|nr:GTPase-associated system all-helical protein GASH [Chitinophaga rhizophila]MBW8683514.1 hypothetical protein [Chitinophaga rhizophila]
MSFTAKQLFPDWYKEAVKKEVQREELDNRRKGIDAITSRGERDFWNMLLKVYLGFKEINEDSVAELVNFFKAEDEYFSTKNDHLLRTLLGCAIAEKIELNDTCVSDYCSVAILIHIESSDQQLADLSKIALKSWVQECERTRKVEITTPHLDYNPTFVKHGVPTWAPETVVDAASLKKFADKIIESFNNVIKEFNTVSARFDNLKKERDQLVNGMTALSEECDILWWLFGGNSIVLNKPLKEVPAEIYGVVLAIELNRMTKNIPGIGKIENLLRKATEIKPELESKTYSLTDICAGLSKCRAEFPKSTQNSLIGAFLEISPLLNVLKAGLENNQDDALNILKTKSILSLEKAYSAADFASQLYKELILSRLYNEIGQ